MVRLKFFFNSSGDRGMIYQKAEINGKSKYVLKGMYSKTGFYDYKKVCVTHEYNNTDICSHPYLFTRLQKYIGWIHNNKMK